MCGISCLFNFNGKLDIEKNIIFMMKALSHRGPDFSNYYVDDKIAIAHNRLSIIDLSSNANQPFFSNNKRFCLSYNGEIYNYKELKKILETKGFVFHTNSDTEVVLNSIIHWGEDSIKKFNGMFSFIFLDRKENEIFVARDRYGIKPIYYYINDSFFAIASEQKAIMQIENFQNKLDHEAVYEYFTFQNIFTNKTFESEIKLFPAGNIGKINLDKKKLNLKKYWEFNFDNNKKISYKDAVSELHFLFSKSVKNQLVSDVEISSFLSGGVDTGSISAVASQNLNKLKTFTCGFDMKSASGIEVFFDERDKAKKMSKKINSEHYELIVNSRSMEDSLDKLVYHLEEPRVGQSYPNYLISKYVSGYSKVILSGTGGDELFAGYPWRYINNLNKKKFNEYVDDYYLSWQRLLNNSTLKNVFAPINTETKNVWTRNIFENVFNYKKKDISDIQAINNSLHFESKTFLHGLLVVEDKLSMAHGLEVRVPFLDNDLVDFAMNCPLEYKINISNLKYQFDENILGNKKDIYFKKTNNGKLILRDVLSKFVSPEVANLNKQGFSGPDSSWFRNESYEFINDIILNNNAKIYNYMDKKIISKLIQEHVNGKINRRLLLWSLLYFETYLKIFKI